MMTMKNIPILIAGVSALTIGAALAQESQTEQTTLPDLAAPAATENDTAQEVTTTDTPTKAGAPMNEDEMAEYLNAQQKLKQTYRLERRIDGVVVETDERTVTHERGGPYRQTEAAGTTLERLKQAFDGELLTRVEAYEEAQLDFTLADVNRDGVMTAEEYEALVQSWWETDEAPKAAVSTEEAARQRQYDAFLAEINPDTSHAQHVAHARDKFSYMASGMPTLSRKDYITEYLLDFFAADDNKDMLLQDNELLKFRSINRGETANN